MRGRLGLAVAALFAGTAAGAQIPGEEAIVAGWTSPTLTRFRDEAEFRRYLEDLHIGYGPAPPEPPVPPPPPPPPAPPSPPSPVSERWRNLPVVAVVDFPGMMLQARLQNADATSFEHSARPNVREPGVDEGDIVKRVGDFLLVLQDGRLFSIDTRPHGRPGLALAGRYDLAPPGGGVAWYNQMLVARDRVVVSGYSERDEHQIVVLRVGADGRLAREDGFLLSSDQQYGLSNYRIRLAGDRLIIHVADQFWNGRFIWPMLRRWPAGAAPRPPRRLLDARAVYRPIVDAFEPTLHLVAACRIGRPAARGTGCETIGFIGDDEQSDSGPDDSLLYVTPTHAYLWMNGDGVFAGSGERCDSDYRPPATDVDPAFVYRLSLADGRLDVAAALGEPVDEMSMAVIGGNFHALARWDAGSCGFVSSQAVPLTLTTIAPARFGARLAAAPAGSYAPLPSVGARAVENRFAGTTLVYGGRPDWRYVPPEAALAPLPVAFVPVADPAAVRILDLPHDVVRIERVGRRVLITGYRDREGLQLSLVDLDGAPRIASTLTFRGRYGGEGTNDAIESRVDPAGGLIGLPTALENRQPGLLQWQSGDTDVSFVTLDAAGRLAAAGELLRRDTRSRCPRTCLDYFRNAHPIFIGGRVLALVGSELVEADMTAGRIREIRRLDLAAARRRRR